MNKIIFVSVSLVIIAGVAGFYFIKDKVNTPSLNLKQVSADFVLKDYNGQRVSLESFRGKNILVNSWASWCPFCRKELSDFAKIQKEVGGEFTVVAINRAESADVAKIYSDGANTSNILYLLDPEDAFYKSIGGFSMPETIFVDKEGFIKYHKRGPMELEEMKRRVQQAFSL